MAAERFVGLGQQPVGQLWQAIPVIHVEVDQALFAAVLHDAAGLEPGDPEAQISAVPESFGRPGLPLAEFVQAVTGTVARNAQGVPGRAFRAIAVGKGYASPTQLGEDLLQGKIRARQNHDRLRFAEVFFHPVEQPRRIVSSSSDPLHTPRLRSG